MLEELRKYKSEILDYLKDFMSHKGESLRGVNRWGKDLLERIENFASQGKMIRGGLVFLSYHLFEKKENPHLRAVGSALELVQSALLVHDDIMDQDKTRRGKKSIYYQYEETGGEMGLRKAARFGESMGICAGDVAFFLAFEILSGLEIQPDIRQRLLQVFSRELSFVGIAQMEDVYLGDCSGEVKEETILSLYRYKTARYTFSLPFLMGSTLAQAPADEIEKLEKIGEITGILFQLRDDELDIFGDEKEIGKPVGSDIKEGKKTLYYHYLYELSGKEEKEVLDRTLGNPDIKQENLAQIKKMILHKGIDGLIREKIKELKNEGLHEIAMMNLGTEQKQILEQILKYSVERNR
jgi:geranylgeranyl diphosphate synthase type I